MITGRRLVLALALAAVLGAGCAEREPPAPVDLTTLHRGNGLEPESLDPHRARGVETFSILRDLYEGLVAEAADGSLIPGVAESWTVSDDGLTWSFALRDARWSNGDPVTAADFVYSFARAVAPETGSAYAPMLAVVAAARAIDARTLELTLTGPTPYLTGLLAHPIAYPVHRASVEAHDGRFTHPGNHVSNGAFKLAEWVPQAHVRLERNREYWDDANTRLDAVVYYPIESESTELARYRAGELHMTRTYPAQQYEWLVRNLGDEVKTTPYSSTYFYGLNLTRPPFEGNRALRAALSMAIDREVIARQVMGAGEAPAWSWVPPGITNYTPQAYEWATWPAERRNAEARRLYEEAGYSEQAPLVVELRYNTAEAHRRVAVAVASMWREVLGVDTRLHNEEWGTFLNNRRSQALEAYRSGWVGDYNDANTFAEAMLSDHGLNDMGWQSAEYDALVRAAGREQDAARRSALLEQAEALMLADYPLIPLYFYVSKALVKPSVGGYEQNVMNVHPSRHLYLIEP